MTTDRLTKLLLAAIAIGLWMIALNPWLQPRTVAAQSDIDLSTVARYLRSIDSNTSTIPYIQSRLSSIESDVDDIEDGSCSNGTIC